MQDTTTKYGTTPDNTKQCQEASTEELHDPNDSADTGNQVSLKYPINTNMGDGVYALGEVIMGIIQALLDG